MLVDGRVAGYGTAQGAEVWWPGNDQGGFDTPRVVVDRADDSIDHLAWSAPGGFLSRAASHADEHALTLHPPPTARTGPDRAATRSTPPASTTAVRSTI